MISLSSGSIGIGLTVRLNNQFSAQANNISRQFTQMYGNAQRVMKANLVAARQVGVGMALAGASGLAFFSGAVNTAADFNYTMKGVKAVTQATNIEMKTLHDQAIAIGMVTKFTAQEVAAAMEELGKGGFEFMDIKKAMRGVADLGAAADMHLSGPEGAASIMSNILNTYGLAATQSQRVADVLSMGAIKSSADVKDFAESIKYAGSALTTSKVPLEDTIAMLGVLANSGQKGSMAGVGLANMYLYLSKAVGQFRTERQSKALEMLGLSPKQLINSKGEIKSIIELMQTMQGNIESMSPVNRIATADALMNIRGARAFVALFRDPAIGKNMNEMLKAVRDQSGGMADWMSKQRMDSLKGDLMILKDTWDAFRISIGETLEPIVRFGARFATKVLGFIIRFARTPLGKPIIILTAVLSAAALIGGTLVVALTSIKLLTMATGVSAANMGRSLVWAWNSAAAAATRYAMVARGVTWVGPGGTFTMKGMKGFQSAGAGAGAAGAKGIFSKFYQSIIGSTGLLGRVATALRSVFSVASLFIGSIVAMVGLKNIIKGVIYAMGLLLNSIVFIVEWIGNLAEGPIDAFNIATANFKRREGMLRKSVGFEEMPIERVGRARKRGAYEDTIGLKEKMDSMLKSMPKVAPTSVIMDGKKVGEVMWETQRSELEKALKISN